MVADMKGCYGELLIGSCCQVVKGCYGELLMALEKGTHDTLEHFRSQCTKITQVLLAEKPENEKQLLRILCNKVHSRIGLVSGLRIVSEVVRDASIPWPRPCWCLHYQGGGQNRL